MTACCCGHLTHIGECGEPITRTFRSNGLWCLPAGMERTLIEDICHCTEWEES